MKKRTVLWALVVGWKLAGVTAAADDFSFYPGGVYDSAIPTLEQTTGRGWGEDITSHGEIEAYLRALAAASARMRIVEYAKSWEGRPLWYVVLGSEANLKRLEEIKAGMCRLADADRISPSEAAKLISTVPAVAWLAYGVHGNEISGPEAALLTAYHLLAAKQDPLAEAVLANCVVIIDPLQNPDGRERFVAYYHQTRGRWPDPAQEAAEHNETWPGGRSNHYLFDMNRDWFALTQPETRGRVKAFLEWYPQVFVDLHEMGSNSTYYFAPPAPPLNPELTKDQRDWLTAFGRNNAAWFDRLKFDYFTRQVFDSFYPGYGEGWPMFHGAIGMTYEQASTRGLVVRREDDTTLQYRDAIQHHFIASLATLETVARSRQALLEHFYDTRRAAAFEGDRENVKEFIIDPGADPGRAVSLVTDLMRQGIRVKRARSVFRNGKTRDYFGSAEQSRSFPAGVYVVPLAQPAKRLAATLLARHTPMDGAFLNEQLRRYKKRLGDEIYDVTGWSLPLLYDVECYAAEENSDGDFIELERPPLQAGTVHGGKAALAYVAPWGRHASARLLTQLLHQGIRVHSSDRPFRQKDRSFPAGSLIIKVKDNPPDLHERISALALELGADVYATDTGWVDEGVNFGSGEVVFVKKPRVALAYQAPTGSSSAGAFRFLLEQVYGYPVTVINGQQIRGVDLSRYDVLVLPDAGGFGGGYANALGEDGARKIQEWISNGGTLVTFGEATRWLTEEKVGLLATTREFRTARRDGPPPEQPPADKKPGGEDKPDASKAAPAKPFDYDRAIEPEKELPGVTPGAILRITVDNEHWLGFGYDGDANVMVQSRNIFTPLKLDKGRNIGVYMPEEKLLLSGFTWADAKSQLAGKAYLMHQTRGRGHLVAFAEDPNYRAFCHGLDLLVCNALFFGPAH